MRPPHSSSCAGLSVDRIGGVLGVSQVERCRSPDPRGARSAVGCQHRSAAADEDSRPSENRGCAIRPRIMSGSARRPRPSEVDVRTRRIRRIDSMDVVPRLQAEDRAGLRGSLRRPQAALGSLVVSRWCLRDHHSCFYTLARTTSMRESADNASGDVEQRSCSFSASSSSRTTALKASAG